MAVKANLDRESSVTHGQIQSPGSDFIGGSVVQTLKGW